MSASLKIAIAGAGVMGRSMAYMLRGHDVTLYDPNGLNIENDFPAKNASGMAGGMLAPFSETEYLPQEHIPAALAGIDFWRNLPAEETGFFQTGTLILAQKGDEYLLERFQRRLSRIINFSLADEEKISTLEPHLKQFRKGVWLENEACLNPPQAMRFLGRTVKDCEIHECRLESVYKNYDWVIDCRGYGAAREDKALRGVKGEIAVVRNADFSLQRPVRLMHRYPLYVVPRPDHIFLIGATMVEGEDEVVDLQSMFELRSAAAALHPSFGFQSTEYIHMQAGLRPAYPDNNPRIRVEGNVIHCNGLFRHGFLLAPVLAQCAADRIMGLKNEFMPLFEHEPTEDKEAKPAIGLS